MPSLIGGGSDNSYINNIFIDSPNAIHIDNRFVHDWVKSIITPENVIVKRLDEIKNNQPPYSTIYPD